MTYRIDTDRVQLMMRQSIDAAVHAAIARYEQREGKSGKDFYPIARAAAEVAIEQFAAYCNSELALIRADHEAQFDRAMLKPNPLIWAKP